MSEWILKVKNRFRPAADQQRATVADVEYCYRLLLNRTPDPEGFAYYKSLVTNHVLTVGELVDTFLGSAEFKLVYGERNKPILVEMPGFSIYVRRNDHFIGASIAQHQLYEPHVTQVIKELVQPGSVFLDIGANIGYFTLLAASLTGADGQVVAVEPQAANVELLRQSLAANGFKHVVVYQNAAAEKEESFLFTSSGADSNGRLINPHEPAAAQKGLPIVQAIVLDDLLANLPRLDVIKMDIEGAEPRAYAGMQRLLDRHQPTMILEFSPEMIVTTSETNPGTFLQLLLNRFTVQVIAHDGSRQPFANLAEVNTLLQESGSTHVDLLCQPR